MPKDIRAPEIVQPLSDVLEVQGTTKYSLDENLVGALQLLNVEESPWSAAFTRFRVAGAPPVPVTGGWYAGFGIKPAPGHVLEINRIATANATGVTQDLHVLLASPSTRLANFNSFGTISITATDAQRLENPTRMPRIASPAEYFEVSATVPLGSVLQDWLRAGTANAMVTGPDNRGAFTPPWFLWGDPNDPIELWVVTRTANQNPGQIFFSGREWKVRKSQSV